MLEELAEFLELVELGAEALGLLRPEGVELRFFAGEDAEELLADGWGDFRGGMRGEGMSRDGGGGGGIGIPTGEELGAEVRGHGGEARGVGGGGCEGRVAGAEGEDATS